MKMIIHVQKAKVIQKISFPNQTLLFFSPVSTIEYSPILSSFQQFFVISLDLLNCESLGFYKKEKDSVNRKRNIFWCKGFVKPKSAIAEFRHISVLRFMS